MLETDSDVATPRQGDNRIGQKPLAGLAGSARQAERLPGAGSQWPDTPLVNMADHEGDRYELFARALIPTWGPRVHWPVRSQHNRRLLAPVGRARAAVTVQVRGGRRGEQPGRLATWSVRRRQVSRAAAGRDADPSPLIL